MTIMREKIEDTLDSVLLHRFKKTNLPSTVKLVKSHGYEGKILLFLMIFFMIG